ncbi:single-stranded DNA-binding protein [Ruminococcaceae bacterium OttesenSCG-928-O06]|nr:single-stranded DNA-binding protein [Ruminococcaceae bacterium OttesenSCG-928-O06]
MLNVVAVMGRLVADPELRKTNSGISTTTFTIACDRNFARAGEERQTDFFDIVAWRSSAEFACKYFRKGQLVAVNGSLQTRTWEDREGKKRKTYEIVADNLHFADSKGSSGASRQQDAPAYNDAPQRALPQEPESYSSGAPEDFAVIDDSADLPF